MAFNYNVTPPDIAGGIMRGMSMANSIKDRQAQEQQQQLIQQYLSGDTSVLPQLAGVDQQAAMNAVNLRQATQPAQFDPEKVKGAITQAVSFAKAGQIDLAAQTLQSISQSVPDEGRTDINRMLQGLKQDPAKFVSKMESVIGGEQPKVGRFARERMGDKLAIIDTATGQKVREYDIPQSRKEQAELAKKTADIAKAESEAQLKVLAAESEEDKKLASIDMALEAANLADDLAADPNLDAAVGTLSTWMPTVFESTQDVINKAQRLESLLTVDNLKLMSGVLTDRDIAFLTRVASGLNITDSGIKGSLSAVKNRLGEISSKIRSGIPQQQKPQSGEVNWADL